ncbi:ABC transporter permease [Thauera sp.]|uniref:ABC transporter permease n=1 Tax=Thauera sp. TaxID=1905334 RepID=UPI00110EDAB2|nr:ABC transporter permease [Thauera sp.]MBP6130481.1 ABC transporter permease [Thauera sp.]MBP7046496.1 ABC transporter permease [Thauera sp.]TMW79467.1 FtsX-like permease family protein [Thauera sp. UPWRP]
MSPADTLRFATRAATAWPLRAALMMLAMSIGVAAVVVLTALGDGARRYVVNEFSALGASLLIVLPGRTETGGVNAGSFVSSTPRELTNADAAALLRLPLVQRVAPLAVGNSEIAVGGRLREVTVVGTSADFLELRGLKIGHGGFLPREDFNRASAVAVIGDALRSELFPGQSAVGRMIRVGDTRLRVIGVLTPSGRGLGMTTDELVLVPVATAQAMFDTSGLFRIFVEARGREALPATQRQIEERLRARRDDELDFTVITQDAVLGTFDRILGALTLGVAGIAAISLAVAGILVMNVMLVAVTQRTAEIGLLKALGARAGTIRAAFLAEAALLSVAGALAGFALGHAGAWGVRLAFPQLPAWPPDWAVIAALATALGTGVLFGVLPARRAARLDPVQALSKR